jgi:hypothetical protein
VLVGVGVIVPTAGAIVGVVEVGVSVTAVMAGGTTFMGCDVEIGVACRGTVGVDVGVGGGVGIDVGVGTGVEAGVLSEKGVGVSGQNGNDVQSKDVARIFVILSKAAEEHIRSI